MTAVKRSPRLPHRHRYVVSSRFILSVAVVLLLTLLLVLLCTRSCGSSAPVDDITAMPTATAAPVPTEAPVSTATPVPTPTPTPSPTPEPVIERTKSGMPKTYTVKNGIPTTEEPLGLPWNPRVPDSYFDDAVFVGDSVSVKLKFYVQSQREDGVNMLGKAQFLTTTDFSYRNALKKVSETSVHPTFRGNKMKVEDAIARIGAKKIYIMLGLNDLHVTEIPTAVDNMIAELKAIRKKNPDSVIIVEGVTPRLSGEKPTTQELFDFNLAVYEKILELSDENGIYFVDIGYAVRDENGNLPAAYCYDPDSMALHFTNQGCQAWVDYLYNHALVTVGK